MPGCTLSCTDQQPRVHGEGFTQMTDFQKDRKKNNASVLYRVYACVYARVCVNINVYSFLWQYIYTMVFYGAVQ